MKPIEFKVVFNRKNELNRKGQGLVQIEAYQNGLRRYFSFGVKLKPKQWKPNTDKDRYTTDDYSNNLILQEKTKLRDYRDKFVVIHGSMTLQDFDGYDGNGNDGSDKKEPVKTVQLTFLDFYKNQLLIEINCIEDSTYKQYKGNYDFLCECFADGLEFEQLTYTTIETYDQYLRKRKGRDGKGMKLNSVEKRHRQTLKFIKIAIKKGYLKPEQNPYLIFLKQTEPVNKVWLTHSEWQKMEELSFEPEQHLMEIVRDMFLFSTYTGIRYNVIHRLTDKDFISTDKGLRLNIISKKKIEKQLDIPLHSLYNGKPQNIAQKYIGNGKARLFYGVTNPIANKLLKEITKLAKIDKYLTFHDSRDTFGTHSVRKLTITAVQDLMQHGDLRTTKGYLHLSQAERDELLENTNWN